MRHRLVPLAVLAAAIAGCAAPPLAPGVPRTASRVVVAPYQLHDECAPLVRGDRLDWRYESSAPIAFSIHYRDAGAVLAPVVRDDSTADAGTFEATLASEFCLTWEAGPPGAIIGYRLLLRRA